MPRLLCHVLEGIKGVFRPVIFLFVMMPGDHLLNCCLSVGLLTLSCMYVWTTGSIILVPTRATSSSGPEVRLGSCESILSDCL
jgi:hypothetical protein